MLIEADLFLISKILLVILVFTDLDSSRLEYPAGRLEDGAQCMKFTTWVSRESAGAEYSVKHCSSSGSIVTMLAMKSF